VKGHDESMDDLVLLIEQDRAIFFDLVNSYESKLKRNEEEIAMLRRQVSELMQVAPTHEQELPGGRCAVLCRKVSVLFLGRSRTAR